MKKRHAVTAVLAVAVTFIAAACTPDPGPPTETTVPPPPPPAVALTGTFLSSLPPADITSGTCNPAGDSSYTFTVSGDATAPYQGTFTETGTVTIGAQTEEFLPGQFRGPITAFSSTFSISSTAGTVQGTKSLVPGTTYNLGGCITGLNPGAQIIASALTYSATITHPTGTFTDAGSTWDNMNMYETPTANSSSLQFRSNFTSTSFGPAATDVALVGSVFEDLQGDGLQNGSGDLGIAGRTVSVYADEDASGSFTAGDSEVASLTTDGDGDFATMLAPGDYLVCQTLPIEWVQTTPTGSACAGAGGSADAGHAVTLNAATPPLLFGNFETSRWRAGVFNDQNGDGIRDASEPFLGGWTVTVYADADLDGVVDPGEAVLDSQLSSAQQTGVSFRLPPGRYVMCETSQAGWAQTRPTTDWCAAVSSSPGGFAYVAQSGGGGNDYFFGNTAV